MAEINFQIDGTALQAIRDIDLKANFEETKLALAEVIHPYTQLIVSEDGIASAKTDRARINKIKTNIDSYRKMVKAAYNEPYKRIEEKFKELTAVCDQGINNIDKQLVDFDERRKREKYELLKEHYKTACETMDSPEYITFELALHPKWENKTTSLEECQKYMDETMQKVDTEVKTIRNLRSEWETSLLNEYQKTHDLLTTLGLNEQLTKRAEQEAERKRKAQEEYERKQAELERQRKEAKEAVRELAKNTNWDEVPQDYSDLTNPLYGGNFEADLQKAISEDRGVKTTKAINAEPEYVGTLRIYGTMDTFETVKAFLDSHAFHYVLVSEEC